MTKDNDEIERLKAFCEHQASIINNQDKIIEVAKEALLYCLLDKHGEIKANSITKRSKINDKVADALTEIRKIELGIDDLFD